MSNLLLHYDKIANVFHGQNWGSSLSESQKSAILISLIFIIKTQSIKSLYAEKILERVASHLSLNPSSPTFQSVFTKGIDAAVQLMSNLTKDQKSWFVFLSHGVECLDGPIMPGNTSYAIGIAESMGINTNEYSSIINNTVKQLTNQA